MKNKLFIIPLLSLVTLTACGDTMSFKPKMPKYYYGVLEVLNSRSETTTYYSVSSPITPIDGKEYDAVYTCCVNVKNVATQQESRTKTEALYVWSKQSKAYRSYYFDFSVATWKYSVDVDSIDDEFVTQALRSKKFHPKKSDVTTSKDYYEFVEDVDGVSTSIRVSKDQYHLCMYEATTGYNSPKVLSIDYSGDFYGIPNTNYMEI